MTQETNEKDDVEEGIQVSSRFTMLLMLGFAIIIVGIIILAVASFLSGGSASIGGVIFIGPFPIVFGAGPGAAWLIGISIAISVVMIVIFLLMRKRESKLAI
ncbi:MAG TPA: DUF131 domain-containing protein [Candidatus Bathyarchaeia archaeon]